MKAMAAHVIPNPGPIVDEPDVESTELDLLLEAVHRLFGYDFRQYARSTVRRRVMEIMLRERFQNLSELQGKVLRDSAVLNKVVSALSVQVSSLFRDAKFYLAFRRKAVPILRTYPSIRIWHAGCASGEEVYSTAIVLAEEGLISKCRLYATDVNVDALEIAATGVYQQRDLTGSEWSYRQAGGSKSLSDYFPVTRGEGRVIESLKKRITFFQHNLVTDTSFNDFHMIFCRNVLIYFNKPLQDRVHQVLYDSLVRFGILGLGAAETLHLTPKEKRYRVLDEAARLYRRTD
jgi:chemotaxis protein methyltransferase CheR